MYKHIQKFLDWGVKAASLAVTAPATWIVASTLFDDVAIPALYFLMRVAAVFLVEGVLLSNWLLLEFDRTATPEIKARYGLTALAMYTALLVIAWEHEGPVGLVFRGALLAALLGSGWDTYVYTWQRATARADRSIEHTRRYRRFARRRSLAEAIHKRGQESKVTYALTDAETEARLADIELYGKRLLADIRIKDREERATLSRRERRLTESEEKIGFPAPVEHAREVLMEKTALNDEQLRGRIAEAFTEDPDYTRVQLANELGIGTTKLYDLINELLDSGVLDRRGRSYHVVRPVEAVMGDNGHGHQHV